MWNAPGRHRIAVLMLDGTVPFDLGTAVHLLTVTTDGDGEPLYDVCVCTLTGGAVRAAGGFRLVPDHGPEAITEAQTVLVPGVDWGLPVVVAYVVQNQELQRRTLTITAYGAVDERAETLIPDLPTPIVI
jgi:transcriptional regulator GlxA family with amidase domain